MYIVFMIIYLKAVMYSASCALDRCRLVMHVRAVSGSSCSLFSAVFQVVQVVSVLDRKRQLLAQVVTSGSLA